MPQEATVNKTINTFENTKKVIIMLFSTMARYGKIGQIVQRIAQKIQTIKQFKLHRQIRKFKQQISHAFN